MKIALNRNWKLQKRNNVVRETKKVKNILNMFKMFLLCKNIFLFKYNYYNLLNIIFKNIQFFPTVFILKNYVYKKRASVVFQSQCHWLFNK